MKQLSGLHFNFIFLAYFDNYILYYVQNFYSCVKDLMQKKNDKRKIEIYSPKISDESFSLLNSILFT